MGTVVGKKRQGGVRLALRKGAYVLEETISYFVRADSKTQSHLDVITTTTDLPTVGETTNDSETAVCTSLSGDKMAENPLYWVFTANFSSEMEEGGGGKKFTDPFQWTPIRETMIEPRTEYSDRDIEGKVFQNAVGEPFSGGVQIEYDNLRWDFFQFEPLSVTDEMIADRHNSINDADWLLRKAHTLLLKVRKSTVGFYYGQLRRLSEYSLIWNESDWMLKIANVGTKFVDSSGKIWPYIYEDQRDEGTISNGPLGNVTVKWDWVTNTPIWNANARLPTGGVAIHDGRTYAKRNVNNNIYYIEFATRRRLSFKNFLRIR